MTLTPIAATSILLLSAGGAFAQTATQFDLNCTGTRQMALDGPVEPHTYSFRVDLAAGRWCWNTCERTFEIVEAAPDRIVFGNENVDTARKRSTSRNEVSRRTGEHEQLWIETRPIPTYIRTAGHCEAAPFSGFPAARF